MNQIIGIDPDIDKSGVAVSKNGVIVELKNLSMLHLLQFLEYRKESDSIKMVYLEAGWLNKKSSWHYAPTQNAREKIAYKVGQNHQSGLIIEHFLKELEIPYKLVRPTETKRDHHDFCILTKWDKNIKTNQEQRDAGMLIVGIK